MSLTIDELIIAASVDPAGIKRGLDQGAVHLKDFGSAAVAELDKLGGGATRSGAMMALALTNSANSEFRRQAVTLRAALLDGMIDLPEFNRRMGQLAQGFNATLSAGMRFLRTEFTANTADELNKATTYLAEQMKREGAKAGDQYAIGIAEGFASSSGIQRWAGSMEQASSRIVVAGRDITQRLATIGVGAAFAFEQMEEGGARGEGAMRRVLRSVGILALSIGGKEGAIVAATALGFAALMDFLNKAEKEAKKAADEIRKHIANAANTGRADDIAAQAREVYFGKPYKEGSETPTPASSLVQGAFKGSLADLRAQLAIFNTELANAPNRFASRVIQNQIDELKKSLDPLEKLYQQIHTASQVLATQPADNVGKLLGVNVSAISPDAKDKTKLFADLKESVGELTTAYETMIATGLRPSLDLQYQLVKAWDQVSSTLASIKDQASPAANALRQIQQDMINAGAHAVTALNAPGATFTLAPGKEDQSARALIERVKAIREATGELSDETQKAEHELSSMYDAIKYKIDLQGGALSANIVLLKAMGEVAREIGAQDKVKFFSVEDLEAMRLGVHDATQEITRGLRDNVEQWASLREGIQGVLDTASGLGAIPHALHETTSGLLHGIDVIKQMQKLTAAATKTTAAGEGLMSLAGLASGIGAIGALVSVISGLSGIFGGSSNAALQQEVEKARLAAEKTTTAALLANTEKLHDLTVQLAAGGISADIGVMDAAKRIMEGIGSGGFSPFTQGSDYFDVLGAAKKAGISITDDSGQIIGSKLQAFIEYLQTSTDALRTFGKGLSDQEGLSHLRDLVYGKTSTADSIASTIDILKQFAPKLGAAFDGLDATTAEGRDKIKSALQALFDALAAGTITADDFGKLGGAKDLANIITTLATGLQSMSTAVNGVTGALTNVPSWYKVNLARYLAADAQSPMTSGALARISPKALPPVIGDPASGGPTGLPGQGAGSPSASYIFNAPIQIDARALSADEIFAAVLKAAKRAAADQFGDSTKWSTVQVART